jgi:hypothetical protein
MASSTRRKVIRLGPSLARLQASTTMATFLPTSTPLCSRILLHPQATLPHLHPHNHSQPSNTNHPAKNGAQPTYAAPHSPARRIPYSSPPTNPRPATRAPSHAQKDLPPSVEAAYYRKCIDLRRRITDISDSNDLHRLRILRQTRGVNKLRLERAFLLEQINKHMEYNADDSDRSSSLPPSPTEKPLRSKRGGRKGTPEKVMMRSALSTPDAAPSYFAAPDGGVPVNGMPTLPPLHSLPALQPLSRGPEPTRAYYDPTYDEQRAVGEEDGARRRAYSGAQLPQNGDTNMADAGFTSVNTR